MRSIWLSEARFAASSSSGAGGAGCGSFVPAGADRLPRGYQAPTRKCRSSPRPTGWRRNAEDLGSSRSPVAATSVTLRATSYASAKSSSQTVRCGSAGYGKTGSSPRSHRACEDETRMSGEASRHERSRSRRSTAVRTNSSTVRSTSRRTRRVSLIGGGACRAWGGAPGWTASSRRDCGLGRNEISTAITAQASSSPPSHASRRRRR